MSGERDPGKRFLSRAIGVSPRNRKGRKCLV